MQLSADEIAGAAMHPTWLALDPVRARDESLARFLREELPPDARFDPAGMTRAIALTREFNEIWPHHVPTCWELVLADRAGQLTETIAQLNAAYARGQ